MAEDNFIGSNRRLWERWAELHEHSEFYDLDGFVEGRPCRAYEAGPGIRVYDFEPGEVGDVTGRRLLHLQCHVGVDTLSWARLGAEVTGVDFSERATTVARDLARRCGIDARFVCSPIYELPEHLDGSFDVVYTSRGTIWWLPDLERWAQVVAHFMAKDGIFYITDFHPFAQVFDDEATDELRVRYRYFSHREPQRFEVKGSYAVPDAEVEVSHEYGWQHSIGDIVTALASQGLQIEFLHEFDWVGKGFASFVRPGPDGKLRLVAGVEGEVPLLYSLLARKR